MKRMVDEKEVVKDIEATSGGILVKQLDGTSKTVEVGGSSTVAWDDIQNKPNFATVATTGDYDDLTDKPSIPAALEAGKDIEINSSNVIKTVYGGGEVVQTAQTQTLWSDSITASMRQTASASPKYYNIDDSTPVDPEDPDSQTLSQTFTDVFDGLNASYNRWDKVLFRIVATENDNNTSIGMDAQDEPVAFLRNGNGWDVETVGSAGQFIELYYRAGSGCWNACVQGNYANGITINEITIIPVQANSIYSKFVPIDNDTIYADDGILKANASIPHQLTLSGWDSYLIVDNTYGSAVKYSDTELYCGGNNQYKIWSANHILIMAEDGGSIELGDSNHSNPTCVKLLNLPTSDPQVAGQLWNDSGVLKISSGI